jgi:hypothetical protein
MIYYIKHKDIDKSKWDSCITKSQNGSIYALSWYLDTLADSWDAIIEDDYHSVMPLPYKRKAFIHYIYTPPFTQQLGIFSKSETNSLKAGAFINKIPSAYKIVDMNLNHANQIPDNAHQFRMCNNYELKLNKKYEALFKAFSTNTKRNIKKGNQLLHVEQTGNISSIINIFIENKGKEINNLKQNDYQKLNNLLNIAKAKQLLKSYTVKTTNDETCAGAHFLKSFNRYIFLFSGTDIVGRKNHALFVLINAFIQEHAGQQAILDFEGSDIQGLKRLYCSFGAENKPYASIRISQFPKMILNLLGKNNF